VLGAVGDHLVRRRLADGRRQELVQDEPLVVPAHHPPGLHEDLLWGVAGAEVDLDVSHHPVVEAQEGQLELGDDQVLVVARIADQGDVLAWGRLLRPAR
jgi:hypothetical protein